MLKLVSVLPCTPVNIFSYEPQIRLRIRGSEVRILSGVLEINKGLGPPGPYRFSDLTCTFLALFRFTAMSTALQGTCVVSGCANTKTR